MLETIPNLPAGVLGFRVRGTLTSADYEDVLIPAVRAARERGDGLRIVIDVPDAPSVTAGAMWDDLKIGVENFTQWKRVAVVSDQGWLRAVVSAASLVSPGQFRGFKADQLEKAIAWTAMPDGGLRTSLTADRPPIALLEPGGRLTEDDFRDAAATLDPVIEQHGSLRGILIAAERFPGWDSFGAFTAHLRFIRSHHRHVRRVAVCAESGVLQRLPALAKHFVAAEIRAFPFADRTDALAWLREAEEGRSD